MVLVFLTPAATLSQAGALATSGDLLVAARIYVLAISAFSVYAGISLWRVSPGAVRRAKAFLWTALICEIVSAAAMTLAGRSTQTTVPVALHVIIFFCVWYSYLETSKRVKATYGLH